MKKLFLTIFLFAFSVPFFMACSTDTHYDSVSTEISLFMEDIPKDGSPMTVHQRFQFDRDLLSINMMSLEEAWLVSPSVSDVQSEEAQRLADNGFTLDFVKSITISLIAPENEMPISWLTIPSVRLHDTEAVFYEFDAGDLRNYVDDLQQLEISIDIAVEPYHAMRYWRDVCNKSDSCVVNLPLSMQFKMEE